MAGVAILDKNIFKFSKALNPFSGVKMHCAADCSVLNLNSDITQTIYTEQSFLLLVLSYTHLQKDYKDGKIVRNNGNIH